MKSRLTIKIVELDPRKSVLSAINQACGEWYCRSLCVFEYLLLNPEDYKAVNAFYQRCLGMAEDDKIIKLGIATGEAWTFPMPDIPREKEHSDAHMAFAATGFDRLPIPKQHVMFALFEEKEQQKRRSLANKQE